MNCLSIIKSIALLLLIPLIVGCRKCKDIIENEVQVRIENNSGLDLEQVTIGSTMYKGVNSFASCSLITGYDDVADGDISPYATTIGNHLGYDGVRITWRQPEGHTTARAILREKFDAELIRNGAVEDSIANVYTGKMMVGLRLPNGQYTYKLLGLSESGNTVEVEIQRD